ncbi:MAG: Ig-like domain-containing protein [Clostridia bacterium]|nr:Ig-like domain-containing protein [Clostridia bacterium]
MKSKLPNNLKRGLKVFGMIVGIALLSNPVNAILKKNLPTSKISDEFPESYQMYIDNLKVVYPNAKFKAVYTGLKWNTVLKHESYDTNKRISTVPKSYSAAWKMNGENIKIDGSFVAASKSAVAYVMDPRNSLYKNRVFQFEGLSYNEHITTDVIEKVIAGSPMVGTYAKKYKNAGVWIDMDLSYSEIINKVGQELKVSSVYIASRMIQETSGDIINNGSINGSNATYPGVYNFFNIGSTPNADGTGSVTNGLKHAKSQGWTTPYLSIYGGVNKIKSTYIKYGQDTVYFQKFDVNNPYGNATALMAYQYQTNILAPISESKISYAAYKKLDMLEDTPFIFYIPVYENMPEDPAPYPAGDTAVFDKDNTRVYLDDTTTKGKESFNIRSSANSELDNIIYTFTETSNDPDERIIFTRTKIGNGYDWDYVEAKIDGKLIKGYVWKDYVQTYEYTKVESITLDKTEAIIEEGDKLTIVATILPNEARFKEVIWTTSDANVLTVENGEITTVGIGTATVTATTEDQGKVATVQVTVKEKTYDITLDKEEYTVEAGEQIEPVITTKNIESYTLKVSDETKAEVIDNKIIKGLAEGEIEIEVHASNVELVKKVKLTVTPMQYTITLDKEEYEVEVDSLVEPVVTLKNIEGYTLEVVDEAKAIVEENKIKGVAEGETVLRVLGTGTDVVKEVKLTVLPKEYKITLDKEEYTVRVTKYVEPIVTLKNIESYTLEVVDEAKAIVEDNKVKGLEIGETTLRVLGTGTEIVKEVKLTVLPNESYTIDESIIDTENVLTNIQTSTTVETLLSKIQIEGLSIKVTNESGTELTADKKVGTGTKVTFVREDGTTYAEKEIVIRGDVTGDGLINSADLLKIVKYLKGTTTLNTKAADATIDNLVNSADLLKIVKHLKGTSLIDFK